VFDDIVQGGVFLVLYLLLSEILGVSNSLYSNFIIKERHGFNKMTMSTFFSDKLKEYLLMAIIGFPVYYGIMKIIVWGGPYFYLYLTAFSVVFIILLMMLIPNVIMPMFNKYSELQDPVLRRRIEEEAERMKFPLKHIYVMDASKRTAHSNAFYYGFGSNKRIVIFDTMLEQHQGPKGIEEIVSVVRHELGHWFYMHPLKNLFWSITNLFLMFTLFSFVINNHAILY
jgi:STE24 endopeptidase